MSQAENFLKSQAKKQETGISEMQAKAMLKAWKSNREKIFACKLNQSRKGRTLKSLSWSVSATVASRYSRQDELGSVASFDLQLGDVSNSEVITGNC